MGNATKDRKPRLAAEGVAGKVVIPVAYFNSRACRKEHAHSFYLPCFSCSTQRRLVLSICRVYVCFKGQQLLRAWRWEGKLMIRSRKLSDT